MNDTPEKKPRRGKAAIPSVTPAPTGPDATPEITAEPPPFVTPEPAESVLPDPPPEALAEPPSEPARAPHPNRSWGWIAAAILLVAVAAMGAGFGYWGNQLTLEDDALAGQLATLRQASQTQADKVAALEQQVTRLAAQPAASAQPAPAATAPARPMPDLGPLEERLKALEARQGDGEARRALQAVQQVQTELQGLARSTQQLQGSAAQASTVLRLSERLDAAEASLRQITQRRGEAEALLLAVGQLREAVNSARPFDLELRAVRTLGERFKETVKLSDGIAPFAAKGIATRQELTERFERLAPQVVRASLGPDGAGWWPETVQRLASLISIRRVDGAAAGDAVPAMVTRAESAVKAGQLDRALAELQGLQGRSLETAKPWIDQAQARVAADKALAELSAQTLANLAGPPAAPAAAPAAPPRQAN